MENICDFCTEPCGNEWCTTAEKNDTIDEEKVLARWEAFMSGDIEE